MGNLSFSSKLIALWSFEVFQFISSTESVCEKIEVFNQAFPAVKIFQFSKLLHRQNCFAIFFLASYSNFKKLRTLKFIFYTELAHKSLSKLFEQGIYKLFQFIFKNELVREKALRFSASFWALEFWNISIRFTYCNGLLKIWVFLQALQSMKHSKFFHRQHRKKFCILKQAKRASKKLKNIIFFSSLNRIFNRLNCFKQAIWYMKLWSNSINFIDWITLGKLWVFQAVYLTFEVVKLINTILRLNHFAKKLRFSNKLFQL